ncbi:helix-turn-helix transcriptional regulator [Nocardioides sp.]|uniref:helix-turn-helix transcriptional regulator n=1 Tax=Nocardioides sp. TaxID=35761 RepID=UPI0035115C52
MAGTPLFLQRLARIPEVIAFLADYPAGLPVEVVAERFGTAAEDLERDLETYLELDSWGWAEDVFHRPALEFDRGEAPDDPDDADDPDQHPEDAGGTPGPRPARPTLRLLPDGNVGLGVEPLSAGDLSLIYTAGMALLEIDAADEELAGALGVIAETMYGAPAMVPRAGSWTERLRLLQDAQEQRRRAVIVYSNAWSPTVRERTIEPLRLVQTRRGWEVDAGPVGPEGNLRTYLLSHVRSVELLDETFTPPTNAETLLERQRATTAVRMTIAQDARWAARQFAERTTPVTEDDTTVTLDLDLLPPVGERVALIMLASGPATTVSPGSVMPAASAHLERLLAHHEGTSPA